MAGPRRRDLVGDRGFVVLNLSDEPAVTLTVYLDQHPMSTEHGRVDAMEWPDPGRPASYVIDRVGIVRAALMGGRDYDQFAALISPHL